MKFPKQPIDRFLLFAVPAVLAFMGIAIVTGVVKDNHWKSEAKTVAVSNNIENGRYTVETNRGRVNGVCPSGTKTVGASCVYRFKTKSGANASNKFVSVFSSKGFGAVSLERDTWGWNGRIVVRRSFFSYDVTVTAGFDALLYVDNVKLHEAKQAVERGYRLLGWKR